MKHFTFQEFERSDTATRHAIDNSIPDRLKGNVAALVDNVLDPLRRAWGKPLAVTSGYRCPELNPIPTVDISKFSTFFSFLDILCPKLCISHFP